jgi:general secretion pathway protein H
MVVALVVLAFALSIVASRGPMRSRTLEARLAASQMAEQLRLARAQAIATDRPVSFVLDLAARRWRVGAAAPHRVAEGTTLSMLSVGQPEGQAAGRGGGAAAGSAPGLAPARREGAISFAPDGSSSGGRIELADGGRRMQVTVDWLTGRVSVAEVR